jgi:hypothetical protein
MGPIDPKNFPLATLWIHTENLAAPKYPRPKLGEPGGGGGRGSKILLLGPRASRITREVAGWCEHCSVNGAKVRILL